MNKPRLMRMLVLLLAFSIAIVGCGGEDTPPKEALMNAVEQSMDMESYHYDATFTMGMEFPETTSLSSDMVMAEDLLNHSEININGTFLKESNSHQLDVNLALAGDFSMNINIPITILDDKMWVKVPSIPLLQLPDEIINKYVELDMNELEEQFGELQDMNEQAIDEEQMHELSSQILDIMFSHFDEDVYFANINASDAGLPDSIQSDQIVQFEMTNSSLQDGMVTFFEDVLPEIFDLLEQQNGLGLAEHEIQEARQGLNESQEELDSFVQSMEDSINIHDFKVISSLDNNSYLTYQTFDFDLSFNDPDIEIDRFALHMSYELTDINNVDTQINAPAEEDTISLEELMQIFFGSMMF